MTRDSIFVGIQVCRNWEQETLSLSLCLCLSLFFTLYGGLFFMAVQERDFRLVLGLGGPEKLS